MCELLVGLPDGAACSASSMTPAARCGCTSSSGCCGRRAASCRRPAALKDRDAVELVDLPVFGRPARLVWRKQRWCCPATCPVGSWTGEDPPIAAPRLALTDRAGRWATEQVGRHGRTVSEVADDLGCDWHTVNDAVIAYGTALVDDDPDRIGEPTAVGIDETLVRRGSDRGAASRGRPRSSTSEPAGCSTSCLVGTATEPCAWFAARREDVAGRGRAGRRWICRRPTKRCSTRCCPTPSRSPTRSTSCRVRHEAPCIRRRVRGPPLRAVAAVR